MYYKPTFTPLNSIHIRSTQETFGIRRCQHIILKPTTHASTCHLSVILKYNDVPSAFSHCTHINVFRESGHSWDVNLNLYRYWKLILSGSNKTIPCAMRTITECLLSFDLKSPVFLISFLPPWPPLWMVGRALSPGNQTSFPLPIRKATAGCHYRYSNIFNTHSRRELRTRQ